VNASTQRWYFLAIITVAQVTLAAIHLGIPILVPLIQKELGLNLVQVGLLGSVLNGGVVLAAIGAGRAADHWGERLIIGYGTMLGGLVAIASNSVSGMYALLFLLVFIGVCTASATPAGSKAVAGWFQQHERGLAMGIRQTSVPLGGTLSALALPTLGLAYGWRWALSTVGFLAFATGVVALRLYQEPPRKVERSRPSSSGSLAHVMRNKQIWVATLYAAVLSGAQWCYVSYVELFLTDVVGLQLVLAAGLLAAGQMCGAGGRIGWGLVSDRLLGGRRQPAMILVGIMAMVIMVITAFFTPETPFWLVSVVVALFGLTIMGWNGLYLARVSDVVGTGMAGVAVGLSNTGAFLGIVVIPPIFGWIVEASDSYRVGWIVLAATLIVPLCVLHWVKDRS